MKTTKIMSIIGIIWFALAWLIIANCQYTDPESVFNWGIISACYGLALSIVCLVHAKRQIKKLS